MRDSAIASPLVWITKRYALNVANVATVFRGTHGEVEIMLVGGSSIQFSEKDLTADGAAMLLPTKPTHGLQLEPSTQ